MKKSITSGPGKQALKMAVEVAERAAKIAIEQVVSNTGVKAEAMQRFNSQGDRLLHRLIPLIKTEIYDLSNVIRGPLILKNEDRPITLAATTGEHTIPSDPWHLFSRIDAILTRKGLAAPTNRPTKEVGVDVYGIFQNVSTTALTQHLEMQFNTKLRKLALTQEQIMLFVKDHLNWLTNVDEVPTLFLCMLGKEVVCVSVTAHLLRDHLSVTLIEVDGFHYVGDDENKERRPSIILPHSV